MSYVRLFAAIAFLTATAFPLAASQLMNFLCSFGDEYEIQISLKARDHARDFTMIVNRGRPFRVTKEDGRYTGADYRNGIHYQLSLSAPAFVLVTSGNPELQHKVLGNCAREP